MPVLFTLIVPVAALAGLLIPISHLFWPQIIEGQLAKQSFVAHLIDAWMKGDLDRGFPVRYFVEPWHAGPIPWAEEVPLFHWIAAGLGSLTGMNAVTAGRVTSFLSALLLLVCVRGLARILFSDSSTPSPESSRGATMAVWLAPALLIWLPGFQIYSASVIPDLAMLSMIALAYWLRLRSPEPAQPSRGAYAALLVACLFKYFAFFSILALFVYDCIRDSAAETRKRTRLRALSYAVAAGLPTLAYLLYFITSHIPNPITEYMGANGYGHLAGPFLFQLRFYLRFVTWVFIKNPTLILSLCAGAGFALSRPHSAWRLIDLHFLAYCLFALVFASSFYVHDYYALPFLLPVLFYSLKFLAWLLDGDRIRQRAAIALLLGTMILGARLSIHETFRLTNFLAAGEEVRNALQRLPDRSATGMVIFASDFSLPVLPMLSRKAGWAFDAEALDSELGDLKARLDSGQVRGLVFYAREPGASHLLAQWMSADPRLASMKLVADRGFPAEGPAGASTRLVVLMP